MTLPEIFVLSGVRTAIADYGSALKDFAPSELGAQVVKEAIKRAGVAAEDIDHGRELRDLLGQSGFRHRILVPQIEARAA